MATRPTSDRLRESVFNILSAQVRSTHVLDLFAGTGALGLEALSRGASHCLFVDNQKEALTVIRKNIAACGLENRCQVLLWDIARNLNGIRNQPSPFDLVFMDPPYGKDLIPLTLESLARSGCLAEGACLVCEHAVTDTWVALPPSFTLTDQRTYGKTGVSFLRFDVHPESQS